MNYKIKPHGGAPKTKPIKIEKIPDKCVKLTPRRDSITNSLLNLSSEPLLLLPTAQVLDSSNAPNMQPATQLVEAADPVATNEAQQVTQWIDDTALQQVTLPNPVVPNLDVLAPGLETREHNIIDVLERPVKLESFEWNDTQTFDTEIKSYDFPDAIISNAPNVADKIAHFTFLRAHIEVRFVVNANTFQAGRLVAYFAPFSNASEIGDRVNVNNYMSAKTVFPRVVLDAGSGNVGELTIPYVSYFTHYDLARGIGDLGTVRISVLNPLQSGSANVSVFARFKDISLQIPTAVPNNLGSFAGVVNDLKTHILKNPECKKKCFREKFRSLLNAAVEHEQVAPGRYRRHLMYDLFDDLPHAQCLTDYCKPAPLDLDKISLDWDYFDDCDMELPKAQVGEAEKKASSGVVSTPLSMVSKIASLGTSLPVIGQYLTPISWIANAGAQVAAFFGLSKSENLRPVDKLANIPGYGFTNVDGVDNSLVLGSSVENEIGTRIDVFGSQLDEMDIPFICKHESFLTNFTWNNAATPGDILFKTIVSPGALDYDNSSGNSIFNSTAMGFVSSMFRYWRGSIKFKIQVTKTAYHSGRLRVAFVPSGQVDDAAIGTYDFNQGYSEIVDLRTSDEIEFTLPFVSNTLWKPAQLQRYDDPDSYESTMGVLVVEVVNALRAPDTVTNNLDCNVWVSSGEDIQFAIPDFGQNVPVIDDTTTIEFLSSKENKRFRHNPKRYEYGFGMPKAQVLGQFQDTGFNQTMQNSNEMFRCPKTEPIDASATSIGEHIQNLRQLIKRFGNVFNNASVTGAEGLKLTSSYFGEPRAASSLATNVNMCPLDYVSWLFRFYRGGVRYKALCENGPVSGPLGVVSNPGVIVSPSGPVQGPDVDSELTYLQQNAGTFKHVIDLIYNRVLEYTVPYFSNTHISLLRGTNVTPSNFDDRATQSIIYGPATAAGIDVVKAAADDFSFGWLVGPPKLARIPPPGTPISVSFDTGERFGVYYHDGTTYFSFDSCLYTGNAVVSFGQTAGMPILWGSEAVLQVIATNNTIEVPITSCFLYSGLNSQCSIRVPIPSSIPIEEISSIITVSSLQLLGSVDIIVPSSFEGTPPPSVAGAATAIGASFYVDPGMNLPATTTITTSSTINSSDKNLIGVLNSSAQFEISLVGNTINGIASQFQVSIGVGLDIDESATGTFSAAVGLCTLETST